MLSKRIVMFRKIGTAQLVTDVRIKGVPVSRFSTKISVKTLEAANFASYKTILITKVMSGRKTAFRKFIGFPIVYVGLEPKF